jgi:predicted Zn-dependent protease
MKLWLRTMLAVFFIGASGVACAFTLDLQKFGDALQKTVDAFSGVSEEQEVEIGQGISAGLLGAAPLVDNKQVQQYVNKVGVWLAQHTERPNLAWTFAVIQTDSYNAFATPGGYILVTEGLFNLLRTEAELAGVLAHEMGHMLQRHHLDAIQKSARRSLATDPLSELASSESQALRSNKKLFSALVDSGMSLYASELDRADEYESDQTGVVLAARYEPFGLPGLLLALDGLEATDDRLSRLTATHPTFRERIEKLDLLVGNQFDEFAKQGHLAQRFLKVRQRLQK